MTELSRQLEAIIREHGLANTLEAIGHAGMEFAHREARTDMAKGHRYFEAVGHVLSAQQFAASKEL